jgi:tyrosinase
MRFRHPRRKEAFVNLEIRLPAYDQSGRAHLTWRPVKATVRLLSPAPGAVPVRLRSTANPNAGQLSFAPILTHQGRDAIDLTLPADGRPVEFWVGGKFGFPSSDYGDVAIEAQAIANGQPVGPVLASHPLMVRVRKNANRLGPVERERFLAALATLNGQGQGIFRQYRDAHVDQSRLEAHGGPAFLPWHRAYLLDLERELQRVDDRVALPFWRFDEAAPNVFSTAFMGLSDNLGRVGFNAGHPLLSWSTDGQPGILRGGAVGPDRVPSLLTQAQTLALSSGPNADYGRFAGMEGDPHGFAHTSHGSGWITRIPTAAKDPLFFLLHCNVDRLWAMWQWLNRRHDPAEARSFTDGPLPGHRRDDTMWPWNDVTSPPRPNFAPRKPMPPSPMTPAPGPKPKVRDMIDYLAIASDQPLGFAYEDVPFQN